MPLTAISRDNLRSSLLRWKLYSFLCSKDYARQDVSVRLLGLKAKHKVVTRAALSKDGLCYGCSLSLNIILECKVNNLASKWQANTYVVDMSLVLSIKIPGEYRIHIVNKIRKNLYKCFRLNK